jgi:L-asparaginase
MHGSNKSPSLPRVSLFALGGTIAMTGSNGVIPALLADQLVATAPGLDMIAALDAQSFRQVPGAHLGFVDIEALAAAIEEKLAAGVVGVVITQGTDTIEETAFALDCLLAVDAPVVVTGAMRNPTLPGADGAANLFAAVRVAASSAARNLGVLVVMNDEIHAARFVRKMHTASPAAFASPAGGPLGFVNEGMIRIGMHVARRPAVQRIASPRDVSVAIVTLTLDDDGRLIDAAVASGCVGVVVAAMGGGHAPLKATAAIERAAASVPVLLASRVGIGDVLTRTYAFPGAEIDLIKRGAIPTGALDGLKARVLLALALRHGMLKDEWRRLLDSWAGNAS